MFQTDEGHRLHNAGRLHELGELLLVEWNRRLGGERSLALTLTDQGRTRLSRSRAVERLARELARHVDAPNPLRAFYFWNRARRGPAVSGFQTLRAHTCVAPFLDRDVFEFLYALPREAPDFHTAVIAKAHPEVADLPYEQTDRAQVSTADRRRAAARIGWYLAGCRTAGLVAPGPLALRAAAAALAGRHLWWNTRRAVYLAEFDRRDSWTQGIRPEGPAAPYAPPGHPAHGAPHP